MIKIENVQVLGLEPTIRGMRNPMNSWDNSDSGICNDINCEACSHCADVTAEGICKYCNENEYMVGQKDFDLMLRLAKAGPVDGKFRRMITVYVDITAPLYWWKEFDTYKVGTVANSCSTMHKIHAKKFTMEDFSTEHLICWNDCEHERITPTPTLVMDSVITALNVYRKKFIETKDKRYWWQMIQLLPSSYNQRRTVMLNYEVLSNIYQHRRNHKLDEWRELCRWIEGLPYSKIITINSKED